MKKGRPNKEYNNLLKSNRIDESLEAMQQNKDLDLDVERIEDYTQEAGQGVEMEFYDSEDY